MEVLVSRGTKLRFCTVGAPNPREVELKGVAVV